MFELGELSDLCPPLHSVQLYTGCCASSLQREECVRTGGGLGSEPEGVCLYQWLVLVMLRDGYSLEMNSDYMHSAFKARWLLCVPPV